MATERLASTATSLFGTQVDLNPRADQDLRNANYGHVFYKKFFHKLTYCHHCTDMLWGLTKQGYICEVCNFVSHERCIENLTTPCSSLAADLVKTPLPHTWSSSGYWKKKFCNVCRKKIDDQSVSSARCEVCDYYAHVRCLQFVVSSCIACATNDPTKQGVTLPRFHHWVEGHLPVNAKCYICKKSCYSAECLTSLHCQWCSIPAHSGCYKSIGVKCDFGPLRELIIPPDTISMPVTNYVVRSRTDNENSIEEEEEIESDKDGQYLKVFDGNASMKNNSSRTIFIPKDADLPQTVDIAMKTHQIREDPNNYFLTSVIKTETGEFIEKELKNNDQFCSYIKESSTGGKAPLLCLRYMDKEQRKGLIKVYPGIAGVQVTYKTISINVHITVEDVIEMALHKFGFDDEDPSAYSLTHMVVGKDVEERVMDRTECPWPQLSLTRRNSLRQMKQTRFYLKRNSDIHTVNPCHLFISGFPLNLSEHKYKNIVEKILLDKNCQTFNNIEAVYTMYGSLVVSFNYPKLAKEAYYALKENRDKEEKLLFVTFVPKIHSEKLLAGSLPLLVFVNAKSGGCQGSEILTAIKKMVNPHQVFNLELGGPLPGLHTFSKIKQYRILICGGDGTVGWVLSYLDDIGQVSACSSPPIGILPLGTGNDLARVLKWGSGYEWGDDIFPILRAVIDAEEIKLDRWTVVFEPEGENKRLDADCKSTSSNSSSDSEINNMFVMNNYFGVGIDADVCLGFHMAREENPSKFNSRIHNKGVYFKLGVRQLRRTSCKDLHRELKLEVDGKKVELPPLEGIIIQNIQSWGSGADPWGSDTEDSGKFKKPSHYDGMLEILGISGAFHMGQIQSGLRTGIRIAQGAKIHIWMNTDMPVQVDGEPWMQLAGQVSVSRSALQATMLKKTKPKESKVKRRNTEPSIPPFQGTEYGGSEVGSGVDSSGNVSGSFIGSRGVMSDPNSRSPIDEY